MQEKIRETDAEGNRGVEDGSSHAYIFFRRAALCHSIVTITLARDLVWCESVSYAICILEHQIFVQSSLTTLKPFEFTTTG